MGAVHGHHRLPSGDEKDGGPGVGTATQECAPLGEEVTSFERDGDETVVRTNKAAEGYRAKHVVVCGGLQADRLARKDGVDLKERVVGFRGDYYELTDQAKHKVRNLLPVPNPTSHSWACTSRA